MMRSMWTTALVAMLVVAFASLGVTPEAQALPRQTLMSGTPCSTCHTNLQGGGMRTEIGWYSMATAGAFTWDQVGFDWLHERQSNEIAPRVGVGWNIRTQMARRGAPGVVVDERGNITDTEKPDRDFFLMQAQPYVSAEVVDWLTVYGTWQATPETFDEPTFCSEDYPGQSCFEAQAIVQPWAEAPALRAGMLQPAMGIRHDDHTMLIRADAGRRPTTLIPPSWAELGAELVYQPFYWLQVDSGVYSSRNLSRAVRDDSVVSSSDVAWLGRVRLAPRLDLDAIGLTTWSGASIFGAGDFLALNTFVGLGILNRLSLIFESAHFSFGGDADRTTRNLSAMASLRFFDWLFLNTRVEETRDLRDDEDARAQAVVTNLEIFPLPWIELRPEYRYTRDRDFKSGAWALQIHLFY